MREARPTSRRAWMGVDIGTQSVRVLLVDESGAVLGRGSVPLPSRRFDDGRHEQDPETWWNGFAEACQEALAAAGPVEVAGLACCATSGTVLLVEETPTDPARPLTPGLMYDDGRAVEEGRRIEEEPAPVWAERALRPQRSWALAKALWMLRRTPPRPRMRLAHQVDLITSRLVGRPTAVDTSHALKTGADPVDVRWPAEDLRRLGLDPALLPDLVRPGTILGTVCPAAAERTGLAVGVPVVAGMTDGCAAQLAAGVLRLGEWSFVLGTTTVLKGVSDRLLHDPTGALYSHRSPDDLWWPGGASNAGAGALSAAFDLDDFPRLERLAAEREPARCLAYPLVGTGERFPFRQPEAESFLVGAPADDEGDRFAAILQGVAFVARLCLDHVRALGAQVGERVVVTGGATRSAYWTQLQADVLRREVAVPEHAEGALGMALLAAATETGLATAAQRMVRPARVFQPRTHADVFDEPYVAWVDELARRGWIGDSLADAARAGAVTP